MRFRGFLLALVLLFNLVLTLPAAATSSGAWVVHEEKLGDRLVELTVHSDAVGRDVGVRLLLPPDWQRFPHRDWPTLYLLHGCCDGDTGFRSWTNNTDATELTAHTNVLIVMPEAGPAGFYSDWVSGPAWETFHLTELRRLLEHRYRSGHQRAVAGLSMGGFGALSYAARHPGFFRAAASYSGVVHTTSSPDLVQGIVAGTGADPNALWGDPVAQARTWAAHNPYDLAERLRGIPVYLSTGNGQPGPLDPPDAQPDPLEELLGGQSVALAERLRAEHVRVTTDFYGPGRHARPYWERALHRSLPMLVRAIT
ncbi:MAG: esterase family protein [Actinophytocola sp.]|uniref:alpha/beta hydrolase n=1 Tax=Actinophytocola sp. TaxID=1872138 RepID=UPI001326035C|nr:alpha/beta hydrolase family protein [Actinophytocola sp.]MPZ86344.1 esterase family protein [Actinophytocola sp.]